MNFYRDRALENDPTAERFLQLVQIKSRVANAGNLAKIFEK